MADLASADQLTLLLGLPEGTDADLLDMLVTQAEAIFEAETNRRDTPFQAAQTDRAEVHDAVGNVRLWLDYPIADVTTIELGQDVNAPDETLDPATQVVFRVGTRQLIRTDGGVWSAMTWALLSWARGGPQVPSGDWPASPSFVQVTYNTQDDLPEDARTAVLQLAAQMYRGLGSEGLSSETLDNYSATFAGTAQTVPGWSQAVARNRRLVAL